MNLTAQEIEIVNILKTLISKYGYSLIYELLNIANEEIYD